MHLEVIHALQGSTRVFVIITSTNGAKLAPAYRELRPVNLRGSKILASVCAFAIMVLSRMMRLTLFGCNNKFFYRLLPLVSRRTRTVDFTHAFSYPDWGMEEYAIRFVQHLDARIVINRKTLNDFREQYQRTGTNTELLKRIHLIPNGIKLFPFDPSAIEKRFLRFTIGFVGRFSPEKRPELFLNIVQVCNTPGCHAKMIIDRFEGNTSDYHNFTIVEGNNDPEVVRREFGEISLLLITSYREGFPLVLMEAMELGIPVIAAKVGSIGEHLHHGLNGYLIDPEPEASAMVSAFTSHISSILTDKELYNRLCINARSYAEAHFGLERSHQLYREIILNQETGAPEPPESDQP